MTELPERARVVVVGGGIVGTSVLYHLARLGVTDAVLLEQGVLSCGTTWHAAGLLGQLRASESGTRLVQYSAALYESLEAETGLATGLKRCGGLTVARSEDRMIHLRRTAAVAAALDLECELVTPKQAQEIYPFLEISDLQGGLWLPQDATVNPSDVTASLARGARLRGARIVERVRVLGFTTERGAVTGVTTDRGHVEAEIVVNCAGQWAKAVGALAGVNVPLHSAEHFYAVTDLIDGVEPGLPILRDPDGYTYVKEEVGGLVVGGFEPDAVPWLSPETLPYPFEFQLLPDNLEHFSTLLESAVHRLPVLETTGLKRIYNGPESFTPDNQFIIGEAPELRNFFVAAGFNSVGIASAGGAGRALAAWIVDGEPDTDLVAVDIRRFAPFHGNSAWLKARVGEVLGLHYAVPWPNRELDTARPFRRSPVHQRLVDAGALLGSRFGWERANVFAPAGSEPQLSYSWELPEWTPWCAAEQAAARESVAVFDQSSFGKILVKGRDAEDVLQLLCTADVAVAPGRAVYTGMLNRRGGYEADVTVTRLAHDEYLVVTSATSPVRDVEWISRHVRADQCVAVIDVSSMYAVLGVMGPRSRALLASLTRADLSDASFRFADSREIDLGHATVRATRITYVGELGWELYVPTELALGVYDVLMEAGHDHAVRPAGYYAINAMRLDKGYRAFGAELTPDHDPVQAGLTFACKLRSTHDFIGREAVERAVSKGPRRRLASFVVNDPAAMMWGGEVIRRNGELVGQVTSAAWSHALGSCVSLGYVGRVGGTRVDADFLRGGIYTMDIAGREVRADVFLRAPFDPEGVRIRA